MGNRNLIVPPILSKIHHKLEHHAFQSCRAPVKREIIRDCFAPSKSKMNMEDFQTRASMQAVTPDPQVTTMGWSREIPEETPNIPYCYCLANFSVFLYILRNTQFLKDLKC